MYFFVICFENFWFYSVEEEELEELEEDSTLDIVFFLFAVNSF